MKGRIMLAALAAVLAVVLVGVASGAQNDQGRRLAGPFCIGKRNLAPLGSRSNSLRAILRAGVVRSVSVNQPCRPWENRKLGLAVTGPPGPKGDKGDPGAAGPAGTQGAQGATGATGAAGAIGPKGEPGAKGDKGERGYKGDKGERGYTGATGATGAIGPVGPAGKDGKDALGDGARWICVHGKPVDILDKKDDDGNGGPLFDGGTGKDPDCKGGAKFAFKVETVGLPVVFK